MHEKISLEKTYTRTIFVTRNYSLEMKRIDFLYVPTIKRTNKQTQNLSRKTWFMGNVWHWPSQLKTNELVSCVIQENIHVFLPVKKKNKKKKNILPLAALALRLTNVKIALCKYHHLVKQEGDASVGGEGEVLPIYIWGRGRYSLYIYMMDKTGRLCLKGLPFSGCRYMKE